MNTIKKIKKLNLLVVIFSSLFLGVKAQQQAEEGGPQIIVDNPVLAGSLLLFPEIKDTNNYRYAPNKVRLKTNPETGNPFFTFVKYVSNVRSDANEKDATEGDGGGYIALSIGLSVTEEEKQEALQELKKANPKAKRITGMVAYSGGTVAIVIKNTDGQFKVVGLGAAPTFDGDFISVSVQLNKKDASLVWQMMQKSTNAISFNFNMSIPGYHAPVEAKISMNFEKIYQHKIFNAGVAGAGIVRTAGDIEKATQELMENGAIKIEQIGKDEKMDELIKMVTEKLTDMCFAPFGSEGSPNWAELSKPATDGKSYLERATEYLNSSRNEAHQENQRIRAENRDERNFAANENRNIREENRRDQREIRERNSSSPGSNGNEETNSHENNDPAIDNSSTHASGAVINSQVGYAILKARPDEAAQDIPPYQPIGEYEPEKKSEESVPILSIVASYKMKTIKQTGIYSAQFKSYFLTSKNEAFGGDIGMLNCKPCFQEFNLDDPLYKQREIVAMIDGLNAQDFGQYVNFVTVALRKKHPKGDITTDEVRIDRKNFNSEGNAFKLMYGWMPGDNDRKSWLDYEYKTNWSFFGGGNAEDDWKPTNLQAINLAPPLQRRVITVQGDPDLMDKAGIRAVNIKFYYLLGGQEQVKQISLNAKKQITSTIAEFMLPKNKIDYDYEITWTMNDNETIKSGKKNSDNSDLYVDILPNNRK